MESLRRRCNAPLPHLVKCTFAWPYTQPCSTPTTAKAAQGLKYSLAGVQRFICAVLSSVWCGKMAREVRRRTGVGTGVFGKSFRSWCALAAGDTREIAAP